MLDDLPEGLSSLGLLHQIRAFPESFEECFMYKEGYNVTPDTVLKVIVFHASTPEQHHIVKQFLGDCDENG